MRRLIGFTIAMLSITVGVARAESATVLTYTAEYSGSYSYRFDSTSPTSSGFLQWNFTWSYRGTAKLDANTASESGSVATPLSGSVGIGGASVESSGGATQHCTLGPIRPDVAPGNFSVGQYGLGVTWYADLPESFVGSSCGPYNGGVPCDTSHCSTACSPPPPAFYSHNGTFDPAWGTAIGPTFLGDSLGSLGAEKNADLKPGTGKTDFMCSVNHGHETRTLDIKSHLAVSVGWQGPTLFIHFDDGKPPEIRQPGTPLKPGKSPQTTPTVSIPPKVPQPPTGGAAPLMTPIGIGCPPRAKSCPTVITVTSGRQTFAKGSFSGLKGGIVALAGLKLNHLTIRRGARKKVTVSVAVKIGRTTHRGSRTVTLTR